MKECPKCHTKYDDTMNFCQKDGCQLQNIDTSATPVTTGQSIKRTRSDNQQPPKSNLIFIIILIIVGILSGIILFSYFSKPAYSFNLQKTKVDVKAEGGRFMIPIKTDAPYSEWDVFCPESWVYLTKSYNSLDIVCDPNLKSKRVATIRLKCKDRKNTEESIELIQADGYSTMNNHHHGIADGHQYVDLGLSVNWATCNVGASSSEDYGDYFAWGEPIQKSSYTVSNSQTHRKSFSDISGSPYNDVAYRRWGGKWRMPTVSECEELFRNTRFEWSECNGVQGRLLTSYKNGATIFLPAAGCWGEKWLSDTGVQGCYWGSTPCENNDENACAITFNRDYFSWLWLPRYVGRSVRPVREK